MDPVILWTQDQQGHTLISQVLSKNGFTVLTSDQPDKLVSMLFQNPKYFLITQVKNKNDITELADILKTLEHKRQVETRPILLITATFDSNVAAFCYEYAISSLYTGPIKIDKLEKSILELTKENEEEKPFREAMSIISDMRQQGSYNEALEKLLPIFKKAPGHVKLGVEIATLYADLGRWKEAFATLGVLNLEEPPHIKGLHLKARCFLKKGSPQEAISIYEKVNLLNPYHADRIVELGRVLFAKGLVTKAKDEFQKAKSLEPNHKNANLGEGQCLLMEGEFNQALSLFRSFTSKKDTASLFNSTAIIAIRNKNFESGLDLYDKAINSIDIKDEKTLSKLYFNKGVGYKKFAKIEQAIACFEQSIALDKDFEKGKIALKYILGSTDKSAGQKVRTSELFEERPSTDDRFDSIFTSLQDEDHLSDEKDDDEKNLMDEFNGMI